MRHYIPFPASTLGRIAGALLVASVLAACQSDTVGSYRGYPTVRDPGFRPTVLSAGVKKAMEHYLDKPTPLMFYVAPDGQTAVFWTSSSPTTWQPRPGQLDRWAKSCAATRLVETCYLLLTGRDLVDPDISFETEIDAVSVQAWETQRVGPNKAKGKIIYFPGYPGWSGSRPTVFRTPDARSVPPVFVALNDLGWDVDAGIIQHFDRVAFRDDGPALKAAIQKQVDAARAEGYRRVILAGLSGGSREIMIAAIEGVTADGLAVFEPGWLRTRAYTNAKRSLGGRNAPHQDLEDLGNSMRDVRVGKVMLAFFDRFPWGREFLGQDFTPYIDGKDHYVLFGPDGYAGHGAVWTARFARQYAGCLDRFLSDHDDGGFDCSPEPVDEADIANWATYEDIEENEVEAVSGQAFEEMLTGKQVCGWDFFGDRRAPDTRCFTLKNGVRLEDSGEGMTPAFYRRRDMDFEEDRLCGLDVNNSDGRLFCVEVYVTDDVVVFAQESGYFHKAKIIESPTLRRQEKTCEHKGRSLVCRDANADDHALAGQTDSSG